MRLTKDTVHEIEAAGPWLGKARRLFLGSSHDLLHAALSQKKARQHAWDAGVVFPAVENV